jgi:hypothetical protein
MKLIAIAAGSVVWLALVVFGFCKLFVYEGTPGGIGSAPATWPADCGLTPAAGRFTLLMFAHPKCPCTSASIEELNRVLAEGPERVRASVLFFRPADAEPDWERTSLWQSAAAISGVDVRSDVDGRLARRFGACTSGSVVLYDRDGRLVFSGGITASRGHAGDNFGQSAVIALLRGEPAARSQSPVFGCSLFSTSPLEDAPCPTH